VQAVTKGENGIGQSGFTPPMVLIISIGAGRKSPSQGLSLLELAAIDFHETNWVNFFQGKHHINVKRYARDFL
jgi:hypothetical protein